MCGAARKAGATRNANLGGGGWRTLEPMPPFIRSVFALLWLIWAAYWWSKSRGVKETVRKESIFSRLSYLILVALAFSLLWVPHVPLPLFEGRFLPVGGWPVWAGIGVT